MEIISFQPEFCIKKYFSYRGEFGPVTKVNEDMFDKSIEIMSHEEDYDEDQHLTLFEITLSNLKSSNGDVNEEDFLRHYYVLWVLL